MTIIDQFVVETYFINILVTFVEHSLDKIKHCFVDFTHLVPQRHFLFISQCTQHTDSVEVNSVLRKQCFLLLFSILIRKILIKEQSPLV